MVRIYQMRVPVPLKGSVGDIVTFSVEDKTFRGVIKEIDRLIAVLALG